MKFNILLFFNCKKVKYLEKKNWNLLVYKRVREKEGERESERFFCFVFNKKKYDIFFILCDL